MRVAGVQCTVDPADLRSRLAAADLPDEAVQALSARLDDGDAAGVARAIALPWTSADAPSPGLAALRHALESRIFAPPPAVDAIVEHVAAHHAHLAAESAPTTRRVLCLSGPDGVGKTAAARIMAEALGRPFQLIDLGQLGAASEIWKRHGQPGALMGAVERAQSAEAVVVLAGLDHAAQRWGDQVGALLAQLADASNRTQVLDPFFGVPFDLSRLLIIVTCRWTQALREADAQRLEVAEFPGLMSAQKVALAQRTLIPQALADHGLTVDTLAFDDNALRVLIQSYTDEAGAAHLDRLLRRVIRKTVAARGARR